MKIGNLEIAQGAALAPMAGVTDRAFRMVCRDFGAALTCTEMVSSKALLYQDKKTKTLLKLADNEYPAAVQIFGNDPEAMSEAAAKAAEISGCNILDINMGCPTPKIVKNGDGCALMLNIENAAEIIRAAKKNISIPLTVKFRKGWDKGSLNAVEFAKMAEECGADAICVHGRTKVQMYSGRADWDIIAEVKAAVHIPVIANGDIFSAADALRALKYTKADMVMVGRASFGYPWIFSEINAALRGEDIPPPPSASQRCRTALYQFNLAKEHKGEHIAVLEARKHYAWYLRGLQNATKYREKISKMISFSDIYAITEEILKDCPRNEV